MREETYTIVPRGLSPGKGEDRNTAFADLCINWKPTGNGLETVGKPLFLSKVPVAEKHPFPQLVEVGDYLWALGRETLYLVGHDGFVDQRLGGIDNVGHPWSCAVFPEYAVITNYKTCLQLRNNQVIPIDADLAARNRKIPVGRCVENWNGQLLVGNVFADGDHHKNLVLWSKVADADVRPFSQGAGGMWMSWPGEILAIKSLREGPVVYGTQGISLLSPASWPAAYGERVLSDGVGIAGPLAITGDMGGHVFLAKDGTLCSLNAGGIQRMGYKKHFAVAADVCPSFSINKQTKEIHVSF